MSRVETRLRKLEGARWAGHVPCCVVCVEPKETKGQAVERHLQKYPELRDFGQFSGARLLILDD